MSNQPIHVAVLGIAFYLALGTTSAEAAKGVKKGNQGHHTVTGVVVNIVPDKSGYGVFHLRTSHSHKKLAAGNAAGAANGGFVPNLNQQNQNVLNLDVTSATRFEHHTGNAVNMANVASLQKGQHVRVRYTGQHAEQVQIYTRQQHVSGHFMRHRTPVYHPHVSHRRR